MTEQSTTGIAERLREENESTMPAASTLRMHARAMANVMSPEERCCRITKDLEEARSTISLLVEKAEPFVRFLQEFMESVPDATKIECATTSLEVFTVGDLRGLSEAVAKAREG